MEKRSYEPIVALVMGFVPGHRHAKPGLARISKLDSEEIVDTPLWQRYYHTGHALGDRRVRWKFPPTPIRLNYNQYEERSALFKHRQRTQRDRSVDVWVERVELHRSNGHIDCRPDPHQGICFFRDADGQHLFSIHLELRALHVSGWLAGGSLRSSPDLGTDEHRFSAIHSIDGFRRTSCAKRLPGNTALIPVGSFRFRRLYLPALPGLWPAHGELVSRREQGSRSRCCALRCSSGRRHYAGVILAFDGQPRLEAHTGHRSRRHGGRFHHWLLAFARHSTQSNP